MPRDAILSRAEAEQVPLDGVASELDGIVRRVAAARLRDPDTIDDVVQETLASVFAVRNRIGAEALAPYAIVTARNLVASLGRDADRHRRHLHRLVDVREVAQPEDELVRREEKTAIEEALRRLPDREREAVVGHEVMGVDTATLAKEQKTTPGGVAVRLARARARLRVEYLMVIYAGEPPTRRCRPVLVALSAGDKRRQLALGAPGHLLACDYCAALSEAVMQRRRSLAALLPLSLFGKAVDLFPRAKAAAALKLAGKAAVVKLAGATGALVIGAVVINGGGDPKTPDQSPAVSEPSSSPSCRRDTTIMTGDKESVSWRSGSLVALQGRTVVGCNLRVLSIPADEGFWVGTGTGSRAWVQLTTPGESVPDVDLDHTVSFTGRVVRHSSAFVGRLESTPGAALLRRQHHHIEVLDRDLRIQ